jgi:hypothetical protein
LILAIFCDERTRYAILTRARCEPRQKCWNLLGFGYPWAMARLWMRLYEALRSLIGCSVVTLLVLPALELRNDIDTQQCVVTHYIK